MSAELNVQLRLLQDQVAADAKSAADTAQKVFSSSPQKSVAGIVVAGMKLEQQHISDIFKAAITLGFKGGWRDFMKSDPNLLRAITNQVTGQKFSIGDIMGSQVVESEPKSAIKAAQKELAAYQKRLEKMANENEPLAKALTGGKWDYEVSKVKDDTEKLNKWLQGVGGGQMPGLDKLGKSILGGKWDYTPPESSLIKGLPEVGGKDLAKVAAMGSIEEQMAAERQASLEKELALLDEVIAEERKRLMLQEKQAASKEKLANKNAKDFVTFKKDMSFLAMPLFNPGSMWATMFSARQTFSAMNTKHGEAFRAANLGGVGAAGATALLVGGATAIGLALKALTVIVKETIAAYEHARQIYAKSLMSGLGVEFTAKRGILASIMGVSEDDVIKFGAAFNYLNPKLEWATSILSKTATPLTQVSWNFKILQTDMSAMFAKIANDFSPAANKFISAFDRLVKHIADAIPELNQHLVGLKNWRTSGSMADSGKKGIEEVRAAMALGVGNVNSESDLADKLKSISSESVLLGMLKKQPKTFEADGTQLPFKKIEGREVKTLVEMWKAARTGNDMPAPTLFMKQLPTSAWEKMGLVIGGRGNTTSDLIRQGNKHLATIAAAVSGNGYVPRSFGMSPSIAQP